MFPAESSEHSLLAIGIVAQTVKIGKTSEHNSKIFRPFSKIQRILYIDRRDGGALGRRREIAADIVILSVARVRLEKPHL